MRLVRVGRRVGALVLEVGIADDRRKYPAIRPRPMGDDDGLQDELRLGLEQRPIVDPFEDRPERRTVARDVARAPAEYVGEPRVGDEVHDRLVERRLAAGGLDPRDRRQQRLVPVVASGDTGMVVLQQAPHLAEPSEVTRNVE